MNEEMEFAGVFLPSLPFIGVMIQHAKTFHQYTSNFVFCAQNFEMGLTLFLPFLQVEANES